MTLSEDEVLHVATLARLGLDGAERERLRSELGAIVDHVSQLRSIDTSDVPETAQVGELENVWREDEPAPSLGTGPALANAPGRDGPYFQVGAIQE